LTAQIVTLKNMTAQIVTLKIVTADIVTLKTVDSTNCDVKKRRQHKL
jgi:hypothetical protein